MKVHRLLLFLILGSVVGLPPLHAADMVVSEFMARNKRTLEAADGSTPDWIEIQNVSGSRTNLAGWYLTDDAGDLDKWTFPSIMINSGAHVLVFASGRDDPVIGSEYHANFSLSANGEYLAIVRPDGVTVEHEYAPEFAPQYEDVSYGLSSLAGNPEAFFALPTPGTANNAGEPALGPIITGVTHTPHEPADADDLLVTAHIEYPSSGVTTVMLSYVVMYSPQVDVQMLDDGTHGDGTAGDGTYGATIPAAASSPGQMIRYAVSADAVDGSHSRFPMASDPADFLGTVVYDPALSTNPPILHWFCNTTAWENYPVSAGNWYTWTDDPNAWGDAYLYYDGTFYAGCRVRKKGSSTIGAPRHKYKVVLPPDHRFVYAPDQAPVREFNIHRFYGDPTYMREVLAHDAMAAAGVPTYTISYIQFRKNDGTSETAAFVEQQDETFLARNGFDPDGALYKPDPNQNTTPVGCADLSLNDNVPNIAGVYNKESRTWENDADLGLLRTNLAQTAGSDELRRYMFDNLNLPQIINYMAVSVVIGHGDRCEKNFYVYRDADGSGEWSMFPWDMDVYLFLPGATRGGIQYVVTGKGEVRSIFFGDYGDWVNYRPHSWLHWDYGASAHTGAYTNSYNRIYDAIIRMPETRAMYLRRLKSVTDQLLGAGAPGYLEDRIDVLDAVPLANINAGDLKTYCTTRRGQLYTGLGGYTEYTNIPPAQPAGPSVVIGDIEHSPSSGRQDQEYIELINNEAFTVDISGWSITNAVSYTFQPGTAICAHSNLFVSPDSAAFRAREVSPKADEGRFVQGNYRGNLSAQGETIELRDAAGDPVDSLAYPAVPPTIYAGDLRLTELMFHPPSGESEFIELQNTGSNILDLTGIRINAGVLFDFSTGAVSSLDPGEFVLVVEDLAIFKNRYPDWESMHIAGEFDGRLANGGELLSMWSVPEQAVVLACQYGGGRGWPVAADGAGHTLVPLRMDNQADGVLDYGRHWRAGTFRFGSPGMPDPDPPPGVMINELVAHTDYSNAAMPEYDSNDWIELFNAGDSPASLTNCYLSDDPDNLKLWAIPPTNALPPGEWIVFDEVTGFHAPIDSGFGLNKRGEQLYLSFLPGTDADRVLDAVIFKGQESDIALGRVPDGGAWWHALLPTPANSNAVPDAHVVIGEIMYHPAPTVANPEDNTSDEYIEIYNPLPSTVALWTEAGSWRLDGGAEFTFPPGVSIPAGGRLVAVPFDPADTVAKAAFFQTYSVPEAEVTLTGPYTNRLSNRGERIAIEKPLLPDVPGGAIPRVIVDEAIYFDQDPWPAAADGTGRPLERVDMAACGNDPLVWVAAITATPGIASDKVVITAPAQGSVYVLPFSFTAVAEVDPNRVSGTVHHVEFFLGAESLGVDASPPYEWTISTIDRCGDYELEAEVVDDDGTARSAPLNFYARTALYQDWTHRLRVTFSGYGGGTTMRDFPALITFSGNIPGFSYSGFSSLLGGDLRFSDATEANALDFEIEHWDPGGESTVWVRVPELASATDFIWAYWGNPEQTIPPPAQAVWAGTHDGVWHLREDLLNSAEGTSAVDHDSIDVVGSISRGRYFNGTNAYVDMRSDTNWYGANITNLTISLWVRPDSSTPGAPFGAIDAGGDSHLFIDANRSKWRFNVQGLSTPGSTIVAGQWQHLALVCSGSQARAYFNGGSPVSIGTFSPFTPALAPIMGGLAGQDTFFSGAIDEVRLESTARSADWISASYAAVANASFAACDVFASGLDDDHDGMRDAWEESELGGTNTALGGPFEDRDADGALNLHEFVAETDPDNPSNYFGTSIEADATNVSVGFATKQTGEAHVGYERYYSITETTGLLPAEWQGIPGYTRIHGQGQVVSCFQGSESNGAILFRGNVWLERE